MFACGKRTPLDVSRTVARCGACRNAFAGKGGVKKGLPGKDRQARRKRSLGWADQTPKWATMKPRASRLALMLKPTTAGLASLSTPSFSTLSACTVNT
jgi:hypothetical protein